MPLLVWSPSSDLAWMGGINRRATRMWSGEAGVDVEDGFPNPWLRYNAHFWYEKVEAWLFTASPIYAPFTPSVATCAVSLNYMFERAAVYLRGAEFSWDPSTREGEAYLYSLLEALQLPLYAYTALTDEGYLSIEESESPGSNAPPRLLPQLML